MVIPSLMINGACNSSYIACGLKKLPNRVIGRRLREGKTADAVLHFLSVIIHKKS